MKKLKSRSILITLHEFEDGKHNIDIMLNAEFTERELLKLLNASCLQVLHEVTED